MAIKRKIQRNEEAEVANLFQAFEEFIAEREAQNLSTVTVKNYNFSFLTFAKFHGFSDETPLAEVTPQHFFKFMNTLTQEGQKPISINAHLRNLKIFFNWCMDEERAYIKNPFKIPNMKFQEDTLKLFTDEDLILLVEKPRRNDSFVTWRSWAIANWILGTGNRIATICEVRIGDINYTRKEITLRHTKNKKAQIIPLSYSLEGILKEYTRMWRKNSNLDDYLFPNVGDEKLTTDGLRNGFKKLCADRGVSRHNPHGLRHNFAKAWVQNNGNIFALQKILGHSTLDMTRRYVKLFSEDLKTDYERFSALDSIRSKARRTQTVRRSRD